MSTIKVDTIQKANGTSQIGIDKIGGVASAGTIAVIAEGGTNTTNLAQGLTKQWCNLDGAGTIGINDSFNVSSVTDNSTGNYAFTCTSNFSNIYHTPSGTCQAVTNYSSVDLPSQPLTTGYPNFRCFHIGASGIDPDPVTYKSCGDLA